MARCDQGYLCEVCGDEVENLIDSGLYLSYIVGRITAEVLLSHPERHIRCNPVEAQFIVDPEFPPVEVTGPFAKASLDAGFVREEEALWTRGWRRLREVSGQAMHYLEYPLPEVIAAREAAAE